MTPAIKLLKKHKINYEIHEYKHDPKNTDFGSEAAEMLGLHVEEVFKTLLVDIGRRDLVVCVLSIGKKLSLKNVAEAFGEKKAFMADKVHAQKQTGYLLGGISPLGQKKLALTLIDDDAKKLEYIYVSGGKRGLDVKIKTEDLARITGAKFCDIGVI